MIMYSMEIHAVFFQPLEVKHEETMAPSDAMPVLCEPSVSIGEGLLDAISMLYALISREGNNLEVSGENSAREKAHVREAELKRLEDALERQRKANEGKGFFDSIAGLVGDVFGDVATLRLADAVSDFAGDLSAMYDSPRFWSDLESGAATIAKWAGRIAAVIGAAGLIVAGTVATGGAAVPLIIVGIAAATASIGGTAISETKCLGSDSDKIGGYMELGGAVASAGGGAVVGAGGAALVGSRGAEAAAQSSQASSIALGVGGGGSQVVSGVAHIRVTDFRYESENAAADAAEARHLIERLTRDVEAIIEAVKDIQQSHRHALTSLQHVMQTYDDMQLLTTERA